MKLLTKTLLIALISGITVAHAKLPDPSPVAKANAAITAAKNAHNDKVGGYQLCLAQDKVAKKYATKMKDGEKVTVPACADPGKFEPAAELLAALATATAAAVPAPATATAVAAAPTPPVASAKPAAAPAPAEPAKK